MDQKTVLLVEDNLDNRAIFTVYLRHHGFRVADTASGEVALELARQESPDIIVLDISIEGIVSSISETIRPLVDEKGLEFDVELDEDLPALKTDPTKLKQVLLNLLENAVKYTDRGSVALRGRPADGRLHLEVEDTGIGIEPDHLELIFEDFRQVDDVPNRAYGGAGLGLSISRKLLAFLGGWISVESEVGRGTRFSVELPLRADPDSLDRTARRMMLDVADPEPGEPDETKEPSAGEARPASAVEPDVERRPAGPDAARDGDPR